ncbi:MAG: 4-hydroxy-tetrahydrodipicolinate synthase [Firmicutes bacterium]|nr:4-hydroxy-tetrahydrodipicolinate synthase [Bacillota bacterium]
MSEPIFGRVVTAMVTPFTREGELDAPRAAQLARRLVEMGSDGLVVTGTTGESPVLATEEKVRLWETVLEAVGDRVPVVAGTGTNCTRDSVHLTRLAERAGASGVMLVTPYYNKPPAEGLLLHFRTIAESTSLPIILYNVPGRTGVNMTPATVARLAEIPNIVALKEASANLDQVTEVLRLVPPGFSVYSGDDSLTLPVLAVGGVGVVSVASHLVAGEIAHMVRAWREGRVEEAARIHRRLFPLFRAMFLTTNPVPVKAALRLAGFDVGPVRPPLCELGSQEEQALAGVMRASGLLA